MRQTRITYRIVKDSLGRTIYNVSYVENITTTHGFAILWNRYRSGISRHRIQRPRRSTRGLDLLQ
mgnify:CR=1 FL=1